MIGPSEAWKEVKQYTLYRPEIAKGDCGIVYFAMDRTTNAKLAMKVYSTRWVFDNEAIFTTESAVLHQLGSLALAPMPLSKEALKSPNNRYLPMELFNCSALYYYLRMGQIFTHAVVHDVAVFLASALSTIHERQCIHRDVNPKHILATMAENGQVKYSLTGLQYFSPSPASGTVGTLAYNAPEAACDLECGPASDIWSFGITLYELATGLLPSKHDPDFVHRVKKGGAPLFPLTLKLSESYRDLVIQCLRYDPRTRPTAAQIAAHPFLKGENSVLRYSVAASPESPFTSPGPPSSPRKAGTASASTLQLAAGASGPSSERARKWPSPLSDAELLRFVRKDFAKFMEYEFEMSGKLDKLKVEKRSSYDPYELPSPQPLSRGAYSVIYLCIDKRTDTRCVLKVVRTTTMSDLKLARLLLGEIEVMLDLQRSPFTIALYDYFVHDNDLCLAIEYCNGGDLDTYVRKSKKPLPTEALMLIAWNVACGLRDMHALKMMHRDINPRNILAIMDAETGKKLINIKMCDYGLSKKVKEENELLGSTILGTFDYFAPEVYALMQAAICGAAADTKYDNKVDVWSYGVLLFFAAYGKTPHEPPGSQFKVMQKKIILYPENPGIPESFVDLITRCLTYEPAERPSFREVLQKPFFSLFPHPSTAQQPAAVSS